MAKHGDRKPEHGTGTFGEVLRQFRLSANLTQDMLAERAGLSTTSIAALERGRSAAPRVDTVALLVEALGLDQAERSSLIAAAAAAKHIRS